MFFICVFVHISATVKEQCHDIFNKVINKQLIRKWFGNWKVWKLNKEKKQWGNNSDDDDYDDNDDDDDFET